MYEIRLFLTVSHRSRKWLIPDLFKTIDVAKSELTVSGDRAEVWSVSPRHRVWQGELVRANRITESMVPTAG